MYKDISPKADVSKMTDWSEVPCFDSNAAFVDKVRDIQVQRSEDRSASSAVTLGPRWEEQTHCLVHVDQLLAQGPLPPSDLCHLLEDEALSQLAVTCKALGRLDEMRHFLQRQKKQEIITRRMDNHGAKEIFGKLSSASGHDLDQLREDLRKAHKRNQEDYERARDSQAQEAEEATHMNKLIDEALRSLHEIQRLGYTADLLSRRSNRARRADVMSDDTNIHLTSLDLADNVDACRSSCSICCSENQIMSIVLKKLDNTEENTTDFALNFPLAAAFSEQNLKMVSSQVICFQCASLWNEKTIYQEPIAAVLPTVGYQGSNKVYINHVVTLAITGGLATGVSGNLQILMSVLDQTLGTKE